MCALVPLVHAVLSLALQVDLRLEPVDQVALVGEEITVELVATAGLPEQVSALDAIVSWDPARLRLLNWELADFPPYVSGFLNDPDGLNDDVTDGEALYTALAPIGAPLLLISDVVVARFRFEVLTSACVGLTPEAGVYGKTRVHGMVPGVEITGTLGPEVVVEVPGTWVDLGGSVPGTGGLVPVLTGDGVLLSCDPWTVTLTDALPDSSAFLVVGLSAINLPLKGGVLVPDLDVIWALPTSPLGEIELTGSWPDGVPGGITFYLQYWILDAGSGVKYSASNGLSGTTP